MVIRQGEIWWADLPRPNGSEPGYERPVVVVQGDQFNQSGIRTVVCVAITSNLRLAAAPGNLALAADVTGLPQDSVANVSQLITIDKTVLVERIGTLPESLLELVFTGIDIVLGR